MACDTFIKIAQKCRRHFVHVQAGEVTPFIEEILSTISTIICDLQPQQVHTFYEAVGYMISAQNEKFVQEPLIERYMLLPNQVRKKMKTVKLGNCCLLKMIGDRVKDHGSTKIVHPTEGSITFSVTNVKNESLSGLCYFVFYFPFTCSKIS